MSLYDKHATTLVKDVSPRDDMKTLVNIFMKDAGINMGNDFSDDTLERAIEIIHTNFRMFPVCYVASAFKKGSLGSYGAGRLVPRTIYNWMNEITTEYQRDQDHKKILGVDVGIHYKDFEKYPMGKAMCWKIDHVEECDWDNVPLKELAEMIGKGQTPTLEYFKL